MIRRSGLETAALEELRRRRLGFEVRRADFALEAPTRREDFAFRALTREDLPLLARWRAAEHVRTWWGPAPSVAELEREYEDALDGRERTWLFLALLRSRPVGLVQWYWWEDYTEADVGAAQGEVGIDYLIGEPGLTGLGLGPRMLAAFLNQVIPRDPRVTGIRVVVAEASQRSWRALEKLGFTRQGPAREIEGEEGPQFALTRVRKA